MLILGESNMGLSSTIENIESILEGELLNYQQGDAVNVYFEDKALDSKLDKDRWYVIKAGNSVEYLEHFVNKEVVIELSITAHSISKSAKISKFDCIDMVGFTIDRCLGGNGNPSIFTRVPGFNKISFGRITPDITPVNYDNYKQYGSSSEIIYNVTLKMSDTCT
jgi:hypothetical protein